VQVVLVTKTLVSRDQDFVAIEHRDCEQIAVFELVPSFFENCVDFHARRVSAGAGRAYPGRTESSCRGLEFEARGCEFKHGFSLFPVDHWKPLDELIDGCSVFKIFKQGSHWNPRVGKHPSAAHLLRIALDRSAFCPGTHPSVSPGDHGNPEPMRLFTLLCQWVGTVNDHLILRPTKRLCWFSRGAWCRSCFRREIGDGS
jgi:hypothetical protein